MALDRQSIEKKDFPIGRRGYDPEAVDAHLRDLADEVDGLRRSARQRTDSVASTASEQVRAVIAAAEASATEITRQAEEEAREIRDDASAESRRVREDADQRAHEYVGSVAAATQAMLQRVDAMQAELNTLLDGLRTGANRVSADLQLLEGNLGELSGVAGRPRFEPEPAGAVAAASAPAAPVEPAVAEALSGSGAGAAPAPRSRTTSTASRSRDAASSAASVEVEEPEVAAGTGGDGDEGARLVALDMALSGTPRDETDRYLAEHFELSDRTALLDEVYATVEG